MAPEASSSGSLMEICSQNRRAITAGVATVTCAALAYRYFGFHKRPRNRWLYEPGSITHYLSVLLERHSQRRRMPVRVYMDGCFDMFHYGHANALRQAKACGDVLIVGVVGDEEIVRNKGPPVYTEEERLIMVESVKWVDEVIPRVPYDVSENFMNELFEKHNIDYIIHGDDPCLLPDGTDAYAAVKKAGRFKMIKRTEGVSTTDIVGRMLMCTTRPSAAAPSGPTQMHRKFSRRSGNSSEDLLAGEFNEASNNTSVSHFCPTSRRIMQFSTGKTAPPSSRVVYIGGAFDMFHAGHVQALEHARSYGDFLLVGVHTDESVQQRRSPHLPILSLHERSLSVLSCKFVDEVIIGAPWVVTQDLLTTFNVSVVVSGSISEGRHGTREADGIDPFELPKKLGKYIEFSSPRLLTTQDIIDRIIRNRQRYEERNAKKGKSEANYHKEKAYVSEI